RHADDKGAKHQVQLRNGPYGYASTHDGEIAIHHLFLGGEGDLDGAGHLRQYPKQQQTQECDQQNGASPSLAGHTWACYAPSPMADVLFQHNPTLSIPASCHTFHAPLPGSHYNDIQAYVKENDTRVEGNRPV